MTWVLLNLDQGMKHVALSKSLCGEMRGERPPVKGSWCGTVPESQTWPPPFRLSSDDMLMWERVIISEFLSPYGQKWCNCGAPRNNCFISSSSILAVTAVISSFAKLWREASNSELLFRLYKGCLDFGRCFLPPCAFSILQLFG